MPILSPRDSCLTVLNLFTTDSRDKQDRLLQEMRTIVNAAAYEGWISSTVHSGSDKPGTANLIQWRGEGDVHRRYAGDEFRHRTVPLFEEMTTSIRLLRTEVAFTGRHPSNGGATEVSPDRDDHTVIELFGVERENLADLVSVLERSHDWLVDEPGYRSLSVLRGVGAVGLDGDFAVRYSQWDGEGSYEAFRSRPDAEWSAARTETRDKLRSLATFLEWNTYRVVHTRSAGQ
ncbi:hypothetical protein GCM10022254_04160 [Actinomadura meridiana]|uniref:Antibiotic biosynthesis monooxygenase n=1 Tax=Actinomadura meridiana TaxID=559626 RepID=A0ABP8BS88_9ACTN